MSKSIYFLFLLLALGATSISSTHAQTEKTKGQAKSFPRLFIKVNPLSAAFSTINLKVEYHITRKISVQLGGFYSQYGYKDRFDIFEYDIKSIEPQVRYYILQGRNKVAPGGLFAAIYMRYSDFDLQEVSASTVQSQRFVAFSRIEAGVYGGYKLVLKKWLSIEGFAGGGFYNQKDLGSVGISLGEFRGGFQEKFSTNVGGTIGVAF